MIEPLETRIAPAKIFAITNSNSLVSFDSDTPGTVSATTAITGLQAGEVVKTIDFRPGDGLLYGVAISGSGPFTGRLYRIDSDTGAATAVGPQAFSFSLAVNTGFASDFDPKDDELRIVAGTSNANFTVSPTTGAIVSNDTAISGASSIAAMAYSDNYAGTPLSRLYAINFGTDDVVEIGGIDFYVNESSGIATKISDVSVTTVVGTSDRLGLDILTTIEGSTAFYSGVVAGMQHLYTLNLQTGAATDRGLISTGAVAYLDIAAQSPRYIFTEGKSFTYPDANGDTATVKTSAGALKPSQFGWLGSADGTRFELTQMKIAGDATFTGANLSFTAKATATGGDGLVNVGRLDATGVDLGTVKIGGNIEAIFAGTNSAIVPAMKSFSALSMGRAPVPGDNVIDMGSSIQGLVPSFVVKGNISQARVFIAKTNVLTITGSILGGEATFSGFVSAGVNKSFTLGGSLVGGLGEESGNLDISGSAKVLKIGGDIVGGGRGASGVASVTANLGTLTVGGSIIGGDGTKSGGLTTNTPILKIAGSIVGGSGGLCGTLSASSQKMVAIGGSVIGGSTGTTGFASIGSPAVAKIGGSIVGGTSSLSGSVFAGTVGTFTLAGSLTGTGSGGYLKIDSARNITIGGNVIANDSDGDDSVGIAIGRTQTMLIKGSLIGLPGAPAQLTFDGVAAPTSVAESIAVKTLTIKGSVVNANVVFGGSNPANFFNVNTAAGAIIIGGDFLSSSISAGFETGADGFYGNGDTPAAADTLAGIDAAIASILIKGRASGTIADGDSFGIVAERIDKVTIGSRALTLSPLMNETIALGTYSDFSLRELAIP